MLLMTIMDQRVAFLSVTSRIQCLLLFGRERFDPVETIIRQMLHSTGKELLLAGESVIMLFGQYPRIVISDAASPICLL